MNLLRVVLGIAIAGFGSMAALLMLIVFFFSLSADGSSRAWVAWVLFFALVEGAIFLVTFYAFRKVMGPTPRDDEGG